MRTEFALSKFKLSSSIQQALKVSHTHMHHPENITIKFEQCELENGGMDLFLPTSSNWRAADLVFSQVTPSFDLICQGIKADRVAKFTLAHTLDLEEGGKDDNDF
jgi:hypothetical protein